MDVDGILHDTENRCGEAASEQLLGDKEKCNCSIKEREKLAGKNKSWNKLSYVTCSTLIAAALLLHSFLIYKKKSRKKY